MITRTSSSALVEPDRKVDMGVEVGLELVVDRGEKYEHNREIGI